MIVHNVREHVMTNILHYPSVNDRPEDVRSKLIALGYRPVKKGEVYPQGTEVINANQLYSSTCCKTRYLYRGEIIRGTRIRWTASSTRKLAVYDTIEYEYEYSKSWFYRVMWVKVPVTQQEKVMDVKKFVVWCPTLNTWDISSGVFLAGSQIKAYAGHSYDSEQSALAVASAAAEKYQGRSFYVAELKSVAELARVVVRSV